MTFAAKTVSGDMLSERARFGAAYALLRFAAKVQRIPFERLLWVLRVEHGEIGGRFHFHALLDSPGKFSVNHRYQLWHWWTSHPTAPWAKSRDIGRSDFRRVMPGDVASIYTMKGQPVGVDQKLQYEVSKSRDEFVILSNSFVKQVTNKRKHKFSACIETGRAPQG